ncbi:MAG: DUF2478 domain-containing protein [Phycisphaerales bacterium]|nr:MAG: DUF2478 domain-containing protein [Phycisphaerales bacterium]
MDVIIATAAKGEGKTSFLCSYIAQARESGRSVGGIASPAVWNSDKRVGYDLLDFRTGRRCELARIVRDGSCAAAAGMYFFVEQAVAAGNAAIVAAVNHGVDVIAIDEIGPLEFAGRGWAPALEAALRDCSRNQELILAVRPSLVDQLSSRFVSPCWSSVRRVTPPWPTLPLE